MSTPLSILPISLSWHSFGIFVLYPISIQKKFVPRLNLTAILQLKIFYIWARAHGSSTICMYARKAHPANNFQDLWSVLSFSSAPLTSSITQSLWAPPWSRIWNQWSCELGMFKRWKTTLFWNKECSESKRLCQIVFTNVESVGVGFNCKKLFWKVNPVHPWKMINDNIE